ncbi:hypothetical protein JCM8547_007679, partial [Rhodosporidiobolus lusitaniae]
MLGTLRDNFRPTNTQGVFRLPNRLWGLTLSIAPPEAFDTFAKEFCATATLVIANQHSLPKTDTILKVVHNEILRTSSTPSGVALLAASDDSPPPSLCPACKGNHWLRACPTPKAKEISGIAANLILVNKLFNTH